MSLADDEHGGYDTPRAKVKSYEVESFTSTSDGSGTGTITFSSDVWWILVLNQTDTDNLQVQIGTGDWIPLDKGLKWLSIPVVCTTTSVKVKHTTTAQSGKVTGFR